jgi:hypothetical protein
VFCAFSCAASMVGLDQDERERALINLETEV